MSRVCIWIHDAAIRPTDEAIRQHPDGVAVFVFDEPSLKAEPWSLNRLRFVFDSVCDLFQQIPQPVKEVHRGDLLEIISACCAEHGCDTVALTDHPDPTIRAITEQLKKRLQVIVYPRDQLATYESEPKRFSRYWNECASQILGYQPKKR